MAKKGYGFLPSIVFSFFLKISLFLTGVPQVAKQKRDFREKTNEETPIRNLT
jgi:hypothetical protein